jgi:hypothetical protein
MLKNLPRFLTIWTLQDTESHQDTARLGALGSAEPRMLIDMMSAAAPALAVPLARVLCKLRSRHCVSTPTFIDRVNFHSMKKLRHFLAAAIPLCLGILCSTDGAAQDVVVVRGHQREIWLVPQGINHPAVDFAAMFQPDAPWQDAASHVDVFTLYAGFILEATQDQIDAVVSDLSRRGIALALETGVINVPHNPAYGCGGMGNVEGYRTVGVAEEIVRKIKAAHGELKYLVMSEPIYYGHYYTGHLGGLGCHSPVHEIMTLSKPTLDVYLREFPRMTIGEIEPTSYLDGEPTWQVDMQEWADEFRAAMGTPLSFMQVDVQWTQPDSVDNALAFYKFLQQLQQQGLLGRVGMKYDGTGQDRTDKAWTKDARDHVFLMEKKYELRPDQVIFQSFQFSPTHAMPDSANDTLTSLVNFYFTPAVKALRGEK